MRSCGDVGKHLKNGFGKKEGGHEIMEMQSVIVPLSGCSRPLLGYSSATLPEQHCPSGLPSLSSKSFSYQDCSIGVFLPPIHIVSYLVSLQCIDGA